MFVSHDKRFQTKLSFPNSPHLCPGFVCRELPSPQWIGFIFETNVQLDNGGNCEKCFQGLHIVLSHHLKSCQYLQRSIDLSGLLEGPKLYSLLIDYVDSLGRVWMGCLCHDIRPWQQSRLFMRLDLQLWILKRASWLPEASCKWVTIFGQMADKEGRCVRFCLKHQLWLLRKRSPFK